MKRHRKIERAIRIVYDSLQSHMPYCSAYNGTQKQYEDFQFHALCVREYAEVIQILVDLIDERERVN